MIHKVYPSLWSKGEEHDQQQCFWLYQCLGQGFWRVLDKEWDYCKQNIECRYSGVQETGPEFWGWAWESTRSFKIQDYDQKVSDLKDKHLKARVVNDYSNFSYRTDKNNVDIDTESVTLAAIQVKYQGLMAGLNSEFKNLLAVTKSS